VQDGGAPAARNGRNQIKPVEDLNDGMVEELDDDAVPEGQLSNESIADAVIGAEVLRQETARSGKSKGPYAQTVWLCLDKETQPRKLCIAINSDWRFESVIMVLILISSIYMVTDNPVKRRAAAESSLTPADVGLSIPTCGPLDANGNQVDWKMLADYQARQDGFEFYWELFFLACFTVELVIKLIAQGLGGYFKDPWNWLDFVVVANGITSQILALLGTGGTGAVSVLRLFRMLRPLRALKRVKGMRVIVNTLISSLPQICRVFMVLVLCCLVLGIVGVQLFHSR